MQWARISKVHSRVSDFLGAERPVIIVQSDILQAAFPASSPVTFILVVSLPAPLKSWKQLTIYWVLSVKRTSVNCMKGKDSLEYLGLPSPNGMLKENVLFLPSSFSWANLSGVAVWSIQFMRVLGGFEAHTVWLLLEVGGTSLVIWIWFILFPLLLLGLQEGLARDTNLQPNQVYNWFANYRRRQKSRFSQVERLVSSTHEKVSAHQAKHQPESGSSMPQAAG